MKIWLLYDEYHDEIEGVVSSVDKAVNFLIQNRIDLDEDIVGYHDTENDEDEYISLKIVSHWENCSVRKFLADILLDKFDGKYWFPWKLEEKPVLE